MHKWQATQMYTMVECQSRALIFIYCIFKLILLHNSNYSSTCIVLLSTYTSSASSKLWTPHAMPKDNWVIQHLANESLTRHALVVFTLDTCVESMINLTTNWKELVKPVVWKGPSQN